MRAHAAATLLVAGLFASSSALAAPRPHGEVITIGALDVALPDGWSLEQSARDEGTVLVGFRKGDAYMTFYAKPATGLDMNKIFANGTSNVRPQATELHQGHTWNVMQTKKTLASRQTTYYMASFLSEIDGVSYYGYSRAKNANDSWSALQDFLSATR